jgi:hypothetical protein
VVEVLVGNAVRVALGAGTDVKVGAVVGVAGTGVSVGMLVAV